MVVESAEGQENRLGGILRFGGGADLIIHKHMALRVQVDLVRDHLMNDMIRNSRGTVRLAVGTSFQFGKNIVTTRSDDFDNKLDLS